MDPISSESADEIAPPICGDKCSIYRYPIHLTDGFKENTITYHYQVQVGKHRNIRQPAVSSWKIQASEDGDLQLRAWKLPWNPLNVGETQGWLCVVAPKGC